MDIDTLEQKIKKYKINTGGGVKDNENKESLPSMLSVFRSMIKDGIPPTQSEFVGTFLDMFNTKGITPRLKRAYLSFVREYHLEFLLNRHFERVVYKEEYDIAGVDFVVYYRGHKFNIHAFVDTVNGRYWRGVKNTRHKFKGTHIDLPLNLSTGKKVGKFLLYTDSHVGKMKAEMDRLITALATNSSKNS